MPKTKHGPALFDVLGENEGETLETLKLPRRRGDPVGELTGQSTKPASEVSSVERLRLAEPLEPPEGKTRLLELSHDRVRLSLTSKAAAVGFFVVLVVLVLAFETGRRSGHGTGFASGYQEGRASFTAADLSEVEVARAQPPVTALVSELLATRETAPGRIETTEEYETIDAGEPGWVRGSTYIVAQEFSADHAGDAANARAFLAERGIATWPVVRDNGSIQLITTRGFDRRDPVERQRADAFLTRLHEAGVRYYAAAGGYRLKGYFKTLKGER